MREFRSRGWTTTRRVRIAVINQGAPPGSAGRLADRLRAEGFEQLSVGNGPPIAATVIQGAQAQAVQQVLGFGVADPTPAPDGSDLTIAPYQDPQEAVSALLTQKVDYAVVLEHAATVAQAKAKKAGRNLARTLNLQEQWARITKGQPRFPMAGLVMPTPVIEEHPGLLGAILDELDASVAQVNEASPETVEAISKATKVPAPIVKSVIPRLQLEMVPARKARPELEDFYTRLSTLSPDFIGGKLPGEGFYAADPR